ncbi:hypothetical protein E3A20_04840 [Planctomyces bekefii]|uniref:Uncharacterized protein n=1 Tax=Planctomyces bekefii TaxID=1653850 RepID=A0A5C6MF29_9PLAN|nr:hypothetical protein E3A20_04840 [Planctomyces bekefii]
MPAGLGRLALNAGLGCPKHDIRHDFDAGIGKVFEIGLQRGALDDFAGFVAELATFSFPPSVCTGR